jgi:stress-induced morphogen
MPNVIGTADAVVEQIAEVLSHYETEHRGADVSLYRQNSVSVRIRVVDHSFSGMSRAERGKLVWQYLHTLPEGAQSHITVLLLLTPEEMHSSFANLDFDSPIPSNL